MLTISLAAVFLVKIHACRVKNARKMSNLTALFSLQARIFPQKTASQTECQHTLEPDRPPPISPTKTISARPLIFLRPTAIWRGFAAARLCPMSESPFLRTAACPCAGRIRLSETAASPSEERQT
ncbi:hypothetical protein CGZ77_08655 [Neisseria sp. KEM232]|nr:hypothetical protein CGZ77_08655 [Neisseria sp. KEM232]